MAASKKTIALSEENWKKLKARKRPGESFNDVVGRLAGERSLLEFAGEASDESTAALQSAIAETRAETERSLDETAAQLEGGE